MTTDSMRYMQHLQAVVDAGVAVIREKTRTYRDSWKKRGGAGAWFTMVRPWDRLENIVARHNGDILAAIEAEGGSGEDGSALACVRDLRNYLTLIEAEMVARGVVRDVGPSSSSATLVLDPGGRVTGFVLEAGQGSPDDGGHHAPHTPEARLDAFLEDVQEAAASRGVDLSMRRDRVRPWVATIDVTVA